MHRVLFHWHGRAIYSYPAFLYLGLVIGIVAGNYAANSAGLNSTRVYIATLILLIPALAGARLFHVISHWNLYRREPERIWKRSEGGAAVFGGVPFMLLASVPLLDSLQLPFAAFWDVAVFTIMIGMVFTRIGCWLNGCCAGRPNAGRFAMYSPNAQGIWRQRIPTQLLEAGCAVLVLAGAIALWNRLPFRGALFLFAVAGYSAGRLVLETTREDQDRIGRFTIHHGISVLLIVLSGIVFWVAWPR